MREPKFGEALNVNAQCFRIRETGNCETTPSLHNPVVQKRMCAHMPTHIHTCMHIYTDTHIRMRTDTDTDTNTHTHTHTHAHTHTQTCTRARTYTHAACACTDAHIY